jgi:quinolinate synthase
LIAPTYSESTAGEDVLVKWISEVTKIAKGRNWNVEIALHPGAKPRVTKLVKRISGNARILSGVSASELREYSAVVTDFSGIAHDSLMLGIPTVSVLIDFDNYQEICPAMIDEAQMQVAYVVRESSELETKLSLAVEPDPLAESRENYVTSVVSGIGALPGVNTREAIMDALNKDS